MKGFKHRAQMRFLKQSVELAKTNSVVRQQLVGGAREGLRVKFKEWHKKGKEITFEAIMQAIEEDEKFTEMMEVIKPIMSKRDLENMVRNMIIDYNKKPKKFLV